MLDPQQDAPGRDALAQEARGQIEAAGSLRHEKTWGLRKMAYEIGQRTEADYRWFRFEAPTELLDRLNHSLKIADGVLRFRIFQVDPDAPVIVPPAVSAPGPSASQGQNGEGATPPPAAKTGEQREERETPPAAEPAPEAAVAETSAESGEEEAGGGASSADR